MKVIVKHLCPVYVEVDADAGVIERVVVDDTATVVAEDVAGDGDSDLIDEVRERALAIVEHDAWPLWEFGW